MTDATAPRRIVRSMGATTPHRRTARRRRVHLRQGPVVVAALERATRAEQLADGLGAAIADALQALRAGDAGRALDILAAAMPLTWSHLRPLPRAT